MVHATSKCENIITLRYRYGLGVKMGALDHDRICKNLDAQGCNVNSQHMTGGSSVSAETGSITLIGEERWYRGKKEPWDC